VKTLLEKAKALEPVRVTVNYSQEELDLTNAWLRDEIHFRHVAKVLGYESSQYKAYQFLAVTSKEIIRRERSNQYVPSIEPIEMAEGKSALMIKGKGPKIIIKKPTGKIDYHKMFLKWKQDNHIGVTTAKLRRPNKAGYSYNGKHWTQLPENRAKLAEVIKRSTANRKRS